jgi:hypothetical protein
MKTRTEAAALLLLAALACGCKRVQSDQDSIRAGIQQHLSQNSSLNMAAMDVDVKQVSVNGDRAQADVEFRLKQGGAIMQVSYALVRAEGAWRVLKSWPTGGQIEHPPMDDVHARPQSWTRPRNLPLINDFFEAPSSRKQPLPPGHPPVTIQSEASPALSQHAAAKKP